MNWAQIVWWAHWGVIGTTFLVCLWIVWDANFRFRRETRAHRRRMTAEELRAFLEEVPSERPVVEMWTSRDGREFSFRSEWMKRGDMT